MNIIIKSVEEWLEALKKPGVLFALFTKTTCAPCHVMSLLLADSAIQVYNIDTDKFPEIVRSCFIQGVPQLLSFRDKKPYSTYVGGANRVKLFAFLEKEVKNG